MKITPGSTVTPPCRCGSVPGWMRSCGPRSRGSRRATGAWPECPRASGRPPPRLREGRRQPQQQTNERQQGGTDTKGEQPERDDQPTDAVVEFLQPRFYRLGGAHRHPPVTSYTFFPLPITYSIPLYIFYPLVGLFIEVTDVTGSSDKDLGLTP
jgi:hypothetical protein